MANGEPEPEYGLGRLPAQKSAVAPDLPYRPRDPKTYRPAIGLIACGGITEQHLKAYRAADYKVVALCDVDVDKAEEKRRLFYPEAKVYRDFKELLKRADVEVVDVATHAEVRAPILEAALLAGKHVLSQKPFVLDLDVGLKLADLADRRGVRLAVNQNGRWAPHFSYIRNAIQSGVIGELSSAEFTVHWDHHWVVGTAFDDLPHLILYDFAIHWFDAATTFFGARKAMRVFASFTKSATQRSRQPLVAQACVEYDGGQATFVFNGDRKLGPIDRTSVAGALGSIHSFGPDLQRQSLRLYTEKGVAEARLEGAWFPDGFHGTMGELLCAIEEKREPMNGARANLDSLALCFAAVASSVDQEPKQPGRVRKLV